MQEAQWRQLLRRRGTSSANPTGREAGGVLYRMMPPLVTRGPEVSPACASPGALGGAVGNSEERLRPPFNLAAGAGLAGPPGPCGLPGSVPALPAARTAARPGHSPSPDSGRSWETPSLTPYQRPPSVHSPEHPESPLQALGFPFAPLSSFHCGLAPHPCSRPRRTLSSHRPAPCTAPSCGPAGLQPLLFAAQEQDAGAGSLGDRAIMLARPRRPRPHRRIHNTPTYPATHI